VARLSYESRSFGLGAAYDLLFGRYYELGVTRVLDFLLRPGDKFVDIGANIGMITLHARFLERAKGRIDCFEPNPECVEALQEHLSINGINNQHSWDSELARRFVEDFPHARFIHTVRDPITNCSRSYKMFTPYGYITAAYAIWMLNKYDKPQPGMESRTRAIRFEDLHLHLEKTTIAVADWLGLPYRPSLHNSTFNGVPWVVTEGTNSWSGPRPEQAIRDTRNISFTDKCLLFAVFNEDFVAWNYSCHKSFKHPLVRVLTFILVFLIPMKIEIIEARTLLKNLPSLRCRGFSYAVNGLVRLFICRVTVMSLLAVNLCRRLAFGKKVLECLKCDRALPENN
jgi:hypothetical protein